MQPQNTPPSPETSPQANTQPASDNVQSMSSVTQQPQIVQPAPAAQPFPGSDTAVTVTPSPVAAPLASPESVGENAAPARRRWWHWHRGKNITQTTTGVFRDVFANVLAAAVLGIIGWAAYRAVGLFGVQYRDVTTPWIAARTSYYEIDTLLFTIKPSSTAPSDTDLQKTQTAITQVRKAVKTFSAHNTTLKNLKASKKGKLASDLTAYQQNSVRYSDYVKNRADSTELIMPALATCGKSYSGTNSTRLLAAAKTCHDQLMRIDTSNLKDPSLSAFIKDLGASIKTYIELLTGLEKTPESDKKTIADYSSKIFAHRYTIDNLYLNLSDVMNMERKKISIDENVKQINLKLTDLTK